MVSMFKQCATLSMQKACIAICRRVYVESKKFCARFIWAQQVIDTATRRPYKPRVLTVDRLERVRRDLMIDALSDGCRRRASGSERFWNI